MPTSLRTTKAPAKRSQHFNTAYPNIVGPAFASSDQTIATFQHSISQHCWPSICKLQPNDFSISTQHIPTFLAQHLQAPAKRSQHFNTAYPNIVGPTFASSGQTTATFQHSISQHCWPSICKLRPNDRNISTQHIATLLDPTGCAHFATLL